MAGFLLLLTLTAMATPLDYLEAGRASSVRLEIRNVSISAARPQPVIHLRTVARCAWHYTNISSLVSEKTPVIPASLAIGLSWLADCFR